VAALWAAFALFALLMAGWTLHWLAHLPLYLAMAVVIVSDLTTRRIPDRLTLPALAYALALAAVLPARLTLLEAALGALVGGGVVFVAAVLSRGAIGGGDVKLMGALGAAIGWKAALLALAAAQVVGGAVGLVLVLGGRANRKSDLPVGALIALFGALILSLR
jgi:Flp pilus assembly protein protease CpaA